MLIIDIIGITAAGPACLPPHIRERISAAQFLAGGERHLRFFPELRAERFIIQNNLSELTTELALRHSRQRCVVLASGDPLFYGIGSRLLRTFPAEMLRIEPAVSSMQLAFARAGLSWEDAALASIHGRDIRGTLLPLLGRSPIGLFTQDVESPARVARFLLDYELNDYEAIVGENLGTQEERVTRWPDMASLAQQVFAPLNYLVLKRRCSDDTIHELSTLRTLSPGIPDSSFIRPAVAPGVMTHQEVRSVLLGKLAGTSRPGCTMWDIGAGLGTVSVEFALARPNLEVIAVESDKERTIYLKQNRVRFGAYNIRIVEGTAPDALLGETQQPQIIFVGGSGGRLMDILDLSKNRLCERGRLAATFVTLENLVTMLQRIQSWEWSLEITELHIACSDKLAGMTGMKPHRGVFLVCAKKPGRNT